MSVVEDVGGDEDDERAHDLVVCTPVAVAGAYQAAVDSGSEVYSDDAEHGDDDADDGDLHPGMVAARSYDPLDRPTGGIDWRD